MSSTASEKAAAIVDPALLNTTLSFLLPLVQSSSSSHGPKPPLLVGFNGLQGAGKTTLVSALSHILQTKHNISVLVLSIDDFYLTRDAQQRLADANPDNALVQYRGQPGTHDLALLRHVLTQLGKVPSEETQNSSPNPAPSSLVKIPRYDKSAFNGLGDRLPESEWETLDCSTVHVVLLEGWCIGFRSLSADELRKRWEAVGSRTLSHHRFDSVDFVNNALAAYDFITDSMDAFIHLDAENLEWVYIWRLQQEHALRAEKGTGMTDEQVEKFVDGYYPAYELYYDGVRSGVWPREKPDRQLRAVVDQNRKLKASEIIHKTPEK